MPDDNQASRIRGLAQDLLRQGSMGSRLVVASGRLGTPIPVQAPGGHPHSWFVPVTVGDRLAGFFQFLRDGTFMRFSSFERRPGDIAGCPPAADWLDPTRIQERAEAQRRPTEAAGRPFLTYDMAPDRLVWAVPLQEAGGEGRLVYVAGQTVYAPPGEGSFG